MSKKEYRWIVPEEAPEPSYGTRGKYDDCIEEFLQSNLKSVRVNIPNVKTKSVYLLLVKNIKKKELKDTIKTCLRGNKVFLIRLE